jgi:DNA-binding LacI/PurR family transcriptional regulator
MQKLKVKDLAEKLGLSSATVSLVLNGRPGISQETRQRVFDLVRELGHENLIPTRSSARTGSLRLVLYKKSGRIVTDTPFFSQLFDGITARCQKTGYALSIHLFNGDAATTSALSDCDGLILLATELEKADLRPFESLRIPFVVLDSYFENYRHDCVVINNMQGAYDATRHLVKKGHRRIGYLKSSVPINNFHERFDGYRKALAVSGLDFDESLVHPLDPTTEGAGPSFAVPPADHLPTAFVADNDIIAIGALQALAAVGIRVPEDVSIVGFDNMPMCTIVQPALTTVQVPKQQLGSYAVDRLVQRIEEPTDDFVKIEVGTQLIERASVREIREIRAHGK